MLKEVLIPFVIALAVCAGVFLGLDLMIMKLMGLSLIYHGS